MNIIIESTLKANTWTYVDTRDFPIMARIRLLNFLLLAHIVGKIRKTVERIEDGLLSPVSDERKFHAIDAPWGSETTAEDERNSIAFSSNRDDVAVEVHVLAKSITEGTTRANEITMSVSRDECVSRTVTDVHT